MSDYEIERGMERFYGRKNPMCAARTLQKIHDDAVEDAREQVRIQSELRDAQLELALLREENYRLKKMIQRGYILDGITEI